MIWWILHKRFPVSYESSEGFPERKIYVNLQTGALEFGHVDAPFCATPRSKETMYSTMEDGSQQEFVYEVPIKPEESVLTFFEEYARRLQSGYYATGKLANHQCAGESILAYPSSVDDHRCSRAVTRGVEALASAVLLGQGFFVYSLRLRFLAPRAGDGPTPTADPGFDTCQLASHHWTIIKEGDRCEGSPDSPTKAIVEHRRGEGVFEGNMWSRTSYPLLDQQGWRMFVQGQDGSIVRPSALGAELDDRGTGPSFHQACLERDASSVEGVLYFVPGSMAEPKGERFEVRVAPIALDHHPDFFFIL